MKILKIQDDPTSILSYILAATSGLFMGLTVAPFSLWFLAWFALIPLWILLFNGKYYSDKYLRLAFIWGVFYHGTAISWIRGIHPMDWLGVPWWPSLLITLFCWLFISFWGGFFLIIWTFFMVHLNKQNPWLRVLLGSTTWCCLETVWSYSSLWWSSLSYTQSPYNLLVLHLGQISGSNTVTFLLVAVNGLLAEFGILYFIENRKVRKSYMLLFGAMGLFLVGHLWGFYLYVSPNNDDFNNGVKVGIIQGNIPNKIKVLPQGLSLAIYHYTHGYLQLVHQGVNAVLTPEAAIPIFSYNLPKTDLFMAIKEQQIPIWIGAFGVQGDSYTNSLFTVNQKGEITSRYDKSKLVPLGEYIPFEEIFGKLIERLSPLEAHQVHGAKNQIFDTMFGRVIVGICYESAFPEIFRYQAAMGGKFILSSSNDAHYTKAMADQHHAQDIMRAIETSRWAVRSTNTGYSAFIDPHGHTLWKSGYNSYETHAEVIYGREYRTLYVTFGDWLTPFFIVISALVWLLIKIP